MIEGKHVLKLQRKITENQRKICRNLFDLEKEETVVFIWWIHPFSSKGFVFTDKRIIWNIPTKISGDDSLEIYHQERGEILFNSKSFLKISSENGELVLNTTEKKYSFNISEAYIKTNMTLLETIFKEYFEEMKAPAEEFCSFNNSIILGIEGFLQKIVISDEDVEPVKLSFKKTKVNSSVQKEGESKIKTTALKTASFIRHFFDFVLDIYSFLVLSFCYLINATVANPIIGKYLDEIKGIPSKYNFLLLMLFISAVYFLLKTIIVFTTRNVKKLPPVLLVVVQIFVWFIANDKYPFLITINFLLIYIFQRICNFSKSSIRIKFMLYFIILISIYLSVIYFM